ncbi:MAG: flavin reductase [Rickettsiaceae bacterium]|jgi:flavin reductase (DIM6/NTAB) family NADH-FMN oxidoreductase RutF|nr:flavin reductase [Rickettsiaceae bacterium]
MINDELNNCRKKIEPKQFKSVLGGFATGITVVTVEDADGALHGFTASSFTSVSLEPPLILFCLHNDSSTLPVLNEQKKCAISILSEQQSAISENFAYKRGNKFNDIDYYLSSTLKYPIITNALGWLECTINNTHLAGDHTVFICEVIALDRNKEKEPLIHYSGKYSKLNHNN